MKDPYYKLEIIEGDDFTLKLEYGGNEYIHIVHICENDDKDKIVSHIDLPRNILEKFLELIK